MRKRIDSFYEYLGSDTDVSFAQWLREREQAARRRAVPERGVVVPWSLTAAMVMVLVCVAGTVAVITKAGGLW